MPSTINTNVASLNAQRNLDVSHDSLATSMQLDDSSKATLETLHSDYLKRWEQEVKPLSEAMFSAPWHPVIVTRGDAPAGNVCVCNMGLFSFNSVFDHADREYQSRRCHVERSSTSSTNIL